MPTNWDMQFGACLMRVAAASDLNEDSTKTLLINVMVHSSNQFHEAGDVFMSVVSGERTWPDAVVALTRAISSVENLAAHWPHEVAARAFGFYLAILYGMRAESYINLSPSNRRNWESALHDAQKGQSYPDDWYGFMEPDCRSRQSEVAELARWTMAYAQGLYCFPIEVIWQFQDCRNDECCPLNYRSSTGG